MQTGAQRRGRVSDPASDPYRIDIIRSERWLMTLIIGTQNRTIK